VEGIGELSKSYSVSFNHAKTISCPERKNLYYGIVDGARHVGASHTDIAFLKLGKK